MHLQPWRQLGIACAVDQLHTPDNTSRYASASQQLDNLLGCRARASAGAFLQHGDDFIAGIASVHAANQLPRKAGNVGRFSAYALQQGVDGRLRGFVPGGHPRKARKRIAVLQPGAVREYGDAVVHHLSPLRTPHRPLGFAVEVGIGLNHAEVGRNEVFVQYFETRRLVRNQQVGFDRPTASAHGGPGFHGPDRLLGFRRQRQAQHADLVPGHRNANRRQCNSQQPDVQILQASSPTSIEPCATASGTCASFRRAACLGQKGSASVNHRHVIEKATADEHGVDETAAIGQRKIDRVHAAIEADRQLDDGPT